MCKAQNAVLLLILAPFACALDEVYSVGLAKVDITPSFPVRLCGYAARTKEPDGTEQKLWAKALAIGADGDLAILMTVDNTGIPANVTEEVAARLKKKLDLPRERFVISSSHTHSGPCVKGLLPNMFGKAIADAETERIARYTVDLIDLLEKSALDAASDRKPSTLAYAEGAVGFAANRRTKGGPTHHALPLLRVAGADGRVRGVLVNYACHCTTLGSDLNKFCGDWAGYAQEYIERDVPGAIAMVSIGCGADQNPEPRGSLTLAQQHGQSLAAEAVRLVKSYDQHKSFLSPISGKLSAKIKRIQLPFEPLPPREEWEKRAQKLDAIGQNARMQLAKLDKGEKLPESIPYFVQTWNFGNDLGMVFLSGEVVVDYVLRLKQEFDPQRLWVSAYCNDVPCYIPSKRILAEGGYEAADAMTYYAQPNRLAPAVENLIVRSVHELMPPSFRTAKSLEQYPLPKLPQDSRDAIIVRPDMKVELVASEPLIEDPVAIDWGIDGKLWVAEMHDFPNGLHENMTPGGRIKVLTDTDGDGIYDKATVFIDKIMYPTGVFAWRKGVLICAAPEIIYAEDTDGDGVADVRKVLFSGFSPQNEQWEVNGLSLGLDNWVYGASSVVNKPINVAATGKVINLGNRDFRMNPDTGEFEAASGRTQWCRVRDDWGNWFGNDNSNLLWHYPLPEHAARRNPYVAAPPPAVSVAKGADVNRLYPASRTLERFNSPTHVNRVTSACGPCIYRDELLVKEFYGNAFICEPVHNLVHRLILEPDGVTFKGHRAPENQQSEFVASTDNWFRPVQVRTGPDGALWVVDMYRYVIEHPRWIPAARMIGLDIRAGEDKGRIYRIYPKDKQPRKIEDWSRLAAPELARKLESPNGTLRDYIQRELFLRQDASCVAVLEELARKSELGACRVQALATLEGLNAIKPAIVDASLIDRDAQVRRFALSLQTPTQLDAAKLKELANDESIGVRFQLALSLGEPESLTSVSGQRGALLGKLAANSNDAWLRAAILSSSKDVSASVLKSYLELTQGKQRDSELIAKLISTSIAHAEKLTPEALAEIMGLMGDKNGNDTWQISVVCSVLDALDRKADQNLIHSFVASAGSVIEGARKLAKDSDANETARIDALTLLGREAENFPADLKLLASLLTPQAPVKLQHAALAAIARTKNASVPELLFGAWQTAAPALRSRILDALLARAEWTTALLDALAKQALNANEIDAVHRVQLLQHGDTNIKQHAEALFAARPTDRKKVVDDFATALTLDGIAANGAALFAKNCAACHAFGGQGTAVGPDLAALTDRSPQALLIAILDPNAAVDGKFISYTLKLRDGRRLSGMIADETATGLTVIQSNGARETILRGEIEWLKSSGQSLMPEGLEQTLKTQELADVIAYLRATPPGKRREFQGNMPERVKPAADGALKLLPSNCEIYGKTVELEKQYGNLGMWNSDADQAVWTIDVPKDGVYEVWLEYACEEKSAGNEFILEIGAASLKGGVLSTAAGNWDNYRKLNAGSITLKAAKQQQARLRAAGKIRGALFDLKGITLVPAK